jgi:hypothetical protein
VPEVALRARCVRRRCLPEALGTRTMQMLAPMRLAAYGWAPACTTAGG